jgi:hypothetical protein
MKLLLLVFLLQIIIMIVIELPFTILIPNWNYLHVLIISLTTLLASLLISLMLLKNRIVNFNFKLFIISLFFFYFIPSFFIFFITKKFSILQILGYPIVALLTALIFKGCLKIKCKL